MKLSIGPVLLGQPQPFRGTSRSAIAKQPATGPVRLDAAGLAGNTVADRRYHGGPDMAVHHYPHDHYPAWAAELGGHDLLAAPGAFGENITTTGAAEPDIMIGDRFRLGSALVEVSQGRVPCSKIDHRFARKGMAARVVETGRCGWYYRVLEPGVVAAGDTLELVERGPDGWSVARVFHLLVSRQEKDPAALRALGSLPRLCEEWREKAAALSE